MKCLVVEGFARWRDLKAAAERWSPSHRETAAFIGEMARLEAG